jgi:glycosyltransferase involved in cell wall biosynthesis
MRILFVDQFAELGGAQHCLLDLIPAFRQQGWQLRFAIAGNGPFTEHLAGYGVQVDSLPGCTLSSLQKPVHEYIRYGAWYAKAARRLREIAAEFEPDIFYVNGPRALPPSALTARYSRIPLLFHAHNRVVQPSALRMVGAHLRLGRARVIACCRHVAHSLLPYRESVDIVYNGVPDLRVPRFRDQQIPVIGVIGRIEPEKGQLEFVRAARLLYGACPSRFVVVGAATPGNGDSYYRRTQEESRSLPITFTGWQDDIAGMLRELDLLVVPSLAHEATPRVIMEAFSAGVPVVAFPAGGVPELIEDGRTGFLVKTRTPEALAARMLEVITSDNGLRANVVRAARRRWAVEFRVDIYQRRMCKIIEQSANGGIARRKNTGRSL